MQAETNDLQYADVNDDVVRSIVETGPKYYVALGIAGGATLLCFFFPWFYQLFFGIGAAGMNHPGVWGTYLASFIFLDRPKPFRHLAVLRIAPHQ